MTRQTYVFRDGKLIPKHLAKPLRRVYGRGPNVISDIEDVRSMIDGKHYSSRRHYRDHVKDNDCQIVGNDLNNAKPHEIPDAPGLEDDIAQAMGELS